MKRKLMRPKIDDTCKKDVDTKRKKRRIGKKNINRKLLYILQCSSMALSWVILSSRRRKILLLHFAMSLTLQIGPESVGIHSPRLI